MSDQSMPLHVPEILPEEGEDLLLRGRSARLEVLSLTDEELLAIDGGVPGVAPLLWIGSKSEAEKELAVTVALRSLAAAGSIVLQAGDGPGAFVLNMPLDARAALQLRRRASAILVAEQRAGPVVRARVLYRQVAQVVLEEDVSPGGLHAFSVASGDTVYESLAAWCNPASRPSPARGPRRVVLGEDAAALTRLGEESGQASVVSVLSAVRRDEGAAVTERRCMVLAFDDHLELGHADGQRDAKSLTLEWVDRDGLISAVASLMGN